MATKRIKARAEEAGARPRRASRADRSVTRLEATPIWEVAQELAATVPDRVWKRVPRDLSKRVDYYTYVRPNRKRS